jgi:hypothetical protein
MITAFGNGFDIPNACVLVVVVVVVVLVVIGVDVVTVVVGVVVDVVDVIVVVVVAVVVSARKWFLMSPSENSAGTKIPLLSTSRAVNAYMPCSSVSGGMKDLTPWQNCFKLRGFESNAAVKSVSL